MKSANMTENNNTLDQNILAPFLREKIDGFGELLEIEKFSGGQSNPTYKLTTNTGSFVLRAKPAGDLLKSAHQVDREYKVMLALQNTDVPVPKMFYLANEEQSPIGRMFFVMEFLDGRIFWDPALSELAKENNDERTQIYDAMNASLAALHNVDINQTGLGDFGKPGDYFARQLSRWTQQYHSSEVDRIEEMHTLINWLEQNLPPDDGIVTLVHGDYRLDNMVFANDEAKVLGILDWELSTLGHPYADLAYQCMQWRLPNAGSFRGLAGIDRKSLGIPTEKEYVASYCKRRNIEAIQNWPFYVAFSFFRLAAILQGVYKRSLDGSASNPEKARTYGAAVPVLSYMAMQMIEEK